MNLKQRFSFIFSCLFSLLLASVMVTVYFLFTHFRQNEFSTLLAEKAQTTAKLLIEVKEIDYRMQKIIDSNSVNKLYNENTQIYDATKKLIYNSNSKLTIDYTDDELDQIREKKKFFSRIRKYDVLGLYYIFENKGYYVLVSAEDTYNNSKLNYLKYLLFGAFIIGTIVVWILSFSLSKRALQPLYNFRKKIQEITDRNLKIRLSEEKREDEINTLANSFNQMMDRIDKAYERQKDFTGNASHEFRTPVARITAQLENLLNREGLDPVVRSNLESVFEDAFQLSEMMSSLLALADINSRENARSLMLVRLDELIFSTVADLCKTCPDFKLRFEIEQQAGNDMVPEISGDEALLKIALRNLLKKAYNYSDNHLVECLIFREGNFLRLQIRNTGQVPDIADTAALFNTFYRGSNAGSVSGSGIGLSIVKRVVEFHGAEVIYDIIDQRTNQITLTFC